ncbi:aminotransferase class I/II-fold pyridoxal phosphate-dependent enzyme [Deinococcus sp. HMF7620]|uniref:Aminotransferase class I/II-fold pyridoxal phosphate-dependent enzyme n=1 Tax=Deinococcus arboris TaxID=2682977 RepID=A0A7C9HPT0_9DEIO|nr:PLP-dependent aminotransferase family protein [Deinococcus arboris]MVN85609.1 aminotransferase class I/II-fold pyridoxal phosphate-dependent enzyme [Deinococcus arboris]
MEDLPLPPAQPGETRRAHTARLLREAVSRGLIPEGARLPGHRRLAGALGVSRNTLVDALTQLEAEGYVRALGRSGTVVSAPPLTAAPPMPAALPLSRWAQRALAGQVQEVGGTFAVDFRVGQPVPELYPEGPWTQALARRAGQATRGGDSDPLGPLDTRRALAAHLNASAGAQVTPDMVMLTGGTQGALDALARVFLEPGRVAVAEDPTYPGARAALAATGAQVVAVPVDGAGLQTERLPGAATLAYVTPGCQYPTAVTLGAARRQALLAWARDTGAFILEDDYAADLHHAGRPPAVLQGLAPERVILLGSFSKSLAPVTRSGFLVAPPEVLRVLTGTRPLTDRVPGRLDALALADVLGSGAYSRHLRRARQVLAHRQEVLLEALGAALPGWSAAPVAAGLHVYLPLPAPWTEADVLARAAAQGVGLTPVGPLVSGVGMPAVLLGFAHLPPEALRGGAARLGAALRPGPM